jgi:hypothetical protein
MARVIVPTCVIYSYSIIIPIAKFDIFENSPIDPKDLFENKGRNFQGYGIFQQI